MEQRIKQIRPAEIEGDSFEIIRREFFNQCGMRPEKFSPEEFAVIQRVIHATGDFSFAHTLTFAHRAVEATLNAIRSGKNILTDVTMTQAGISKPLLNKWGGKVICRLKDDEVRHKATAMKQTRSETAIGFGLQNDIGLIVIGNAPTALLKSMDIIDNGQFEPKPVIIGVPVGFVNAAESKELLMSKPYPFISVKGRKGGSPVAAAIVNAMLRMA